MIREQIRTIVQEAFDSLFETGMIEEAIIADDNTVLIGTGSALDSVAFVTLFMDLEERLSIHTNSEIYLILTDIHDFNSDNKVLNVKVLIDFIESVIK